MTTAHRHVTAKYYEASRGRLLILKVPGIMKTDLLYT